MDTQLPEEAGEELRSERVLLVWRYTRELDVIKRAQILQQLSATLQAEWRLEPDRLIGEVEVRAGSSALEAVPDYERYSDLLPQVLAGMLLFDSVEYAKFVELVARWDACLAEFLELEGAAQAGYATPEEEPATSYPTWDLSFLASHRTGIVPDIEERAESIWRATLDYAWDLVVVDSWVHLQIRFTARR